MKKTLFVLTTMLMLAGCYAHTDGNSVTVGESGGAHYGRHCPPGQAMKHRC